MKLKNILIVVSDIKASVAFYRSIFGLEVVSNLGGKCYSYRRPGASGT